MQVTVEAKDLRRMFADLKPVLRNSMDGGLLGLAVENGFLIFTAKSGIVYERRFPCQQQGPMSVTVIYRDIADFLTGGGPAVLDISEKSVTIRTAQFSTTFPPAYGEVQPYQKRCQDPKQVTPGIYLKLAQTFGELSTVSRALKKESSILLSDGFAICKYPTIWLEVPYNGFTTTISTKELRTIANFNPKYCAVSDEAAEFYNGSALLAVPRSPLATVKNCGEILVNPSAPMPLPRYGCLEECTSLSRTVKGNCKLTACKDGWRVQYKSQDVEMAFSVGQCLHSYYTLDTYVEYLVMLFRLLGDEQEAYLVKADNAVMFEVPGRFRLVHSIL